METNIEKKPKFSESITAKAIIIGIMTLLMLIPASMIEGLISERQNYSEQVTSEINNKWSLDQTLTGPILGIPYLYTYTEGKKTLTERHVLHIFPENLKVKGLLLPESRHFGIYKSILYSSDLQLSGHFGKPDFSNIKHTQILWNEATIMLGISDLRGIRNNIDFTINGLHFGAEPDGIDQTVLKQGLCIAPKNGMLFQTEKDIPFSCKLNLNGSSSISFIPVGKTTSVSLSGNWQSPSFIGAFSPEHTIDERGFNANWKVLHYNRSLPLSFVDNEIESLESSSFGVNLLETVGKYQKNMRSAKYALMFIVLTFVIFFFVEIFTKKKIHPIQYLLVAIALIIFYSLLLSISEQLNFDWAYLIASVATIALITSYGYSIFKQKLPSFILGFILTTLYIFLYVILQLEDMALLFGSLGLFCVLGIIMYFSKKIDWYKQNKKEVEV